MAKRLARRIIFKVPQPYFGMSVCREDEAPAEFFRIFYSCHQFEARQEPRTPDKQKLGRSLALPQNRSSAGASHSRKTEARQEPRTPAKQMLGRRLALPQNRSSAGASPSEIRILLDFYFILLGLHMNHAWLLTNPANDGNGEKVVRSISNTFPTLRRMYFQLNP